MSETASSTQPISLILMENNYKTVSVSPTTNSLCIDQRIFITFYGALFPWQISENPTGNRITKAHLVFIKGERAQTACWI